jgi:tRNA 2-thiouridine synthesizing protein A
MTTLPESAPNSALNPAPLAATTLNLRGLKCPLPALRTRKALKGLPPGTALVVECTDPMAAIDIPNLVRETGDTLDEHSVRAEMSAQHASVDVLTFVITKT